MEELKKRIIELLEEAIDQEEAQMSQKQFLFLALTIITKQYFKIVSQIAPLVHLAVAGGYVFRFDPSQVITPTTTNLTTGYSTTILNVEWHESR